MAVTEKVRLLLLEELMKAKARNPSYSMRSYSKKIGISQSAVSEILSGKRTITEKSARKILSGLSIEPQKIARILEDQLSTSPTDKYRSIDMDTFHLISDWHYYAILSLAQTKGFKSSPEWISRRLGLGIKLTEDAISRLIRLDLLAIDLSGKLRATGERIEAISAIANPALKKANYQNLDLAMKALAEDPVKNRDFTALTLCFDPDRIEEARKMIKIFRRNFDRAMESGRKKEVYKLCIQLFPLTKG